VLRHLSGEESQQTRKGVSLVPQGIEASKKGKSMSMLTDVEEHYIQSSFTLYQHQLGVAFAPPRLHPILGHGTQARFRLFF
jgi:hypothetical protein